MAGGLMREQARRKAQSQIWGIQTSLHKMSSNALELHFRQGIFILKSLLNTRMLALLPLKN
jgi:hypothetical protein